MLKDATTKEQLAALAMVGMLASQAEGFAFSNEQGLAQAAFDQAEAMLAEAKQRKENT